MGWMKKVAQWVVSTIMFIVALIVAIILIIVFLVALAFGKKDFAEEIMDTLLLEHDYGYE